MVPPSDPLRIGVLGAARIAPMALLRPARAVAEVEVAAVAARDPERARAFARRHRIPRVHASYEDLVADPDLDAIYVPLPNALHCDWTLRSLEAGKHVLCEKPLASNAAEAERMTAGAQTHGRVLMEAFHWRYHPLAERMGEVVGSGDLGEVRELEAHMCIPLWVPGDIRFSYELGGGAAMDVGCYTISLLRYLAGAEPRVVGARASTTRSPRVDRAMEADFEFDDGRRGHITCSLLSRIPLRLSARVRGSRGEMRVWNPYVPQFPHRLSVRTGSGRAGERVRGEPTYTGQLRAFVRAVREGAPLPTDGRHGIRNMRVIDAVYAKAGLPPRGT